MPVTEQSLSTTRTGADGASPSASNAAEERPKVTLIPLGNGGTYRVNGMIRSAVTGRYLTQPPDDRVRIAAARLRVTTDAKQGLPTPQWVKDLAQQPKELPMTADIPEGFEPAEVSFAKDHVHNAIEQELEKQGIDPYSERADQPSPDLIDLADAVVERLLTEGVTIPASVRRLH